MGKEINHDGTTNPIAPWGVLKPVIQPPGFRSVPATMIRARSMPSITGGSGGGRANKAAQSVGEFMAKPDARKAGFQAQPEEESAPKGSPLKDTVSKANREA